MTQNEKNEQLLDAARRGRAEDAKRLVSEGADPAHLDHAALRIAARKGHAEFAKALLPAEAAEAAAVAREAAEAARKGNDRIGADALARIAGLEPERPRPRGRM